MENNKEKKIESISEISHESGAGVFDDESTSVIAESSISEDEIESLSKAQLAKKIEEYFNAEELNSVFSEISLIKKQWDTLVKEENEIKLKAFIQDGTPAKDFEPKKDALDDKTELIWKNINAKRASQRKLKEKNAQENISTKKLIIEELKELLKGNESFFASYNKFQALQSKWRLTGNFSNQESVTLRENYFFLTGKFYDMVKINNELNILDKKKNKEQKALLCEKAENLSLEPSLRKALDRLAHLQEEWGDLRNSLRGLKDPLLLRFKTAGNIILDRKKEHLLQVQEQQKSNLLAKTELCHQIESLLQINIISLKHCRELADKEALIWEAWQKISFVPKSDNGNCWKRFKAARVQFHQALDLFYGNQRKDFAQNLEKKIALCVKAEMQQESKDWQSTSELLKKLQIEWKTIGQVAIKDSDAVWLRFRKACDYFFDSKSSQINANENAIKILIQNKETLISKIEAFQPSDDFNNGIEELKKFQEEWTSTGEEPLKESSRLNNAFGRASEKLLERIKTASKVEDKLFYRLKYEQMLKSPQGTDQIKKERSALQDKIRKVQAEVDQLENNLSFFGNGKSANPFIAEYQIKMENGKLEVKELALKLKFIPSV